MSSIRTAHFPWASAGRKRDCLSTSVPAASHAGCRCPSCPCIPLQHMTTVGGCLLGVVPPIWRMHEKNVVYWFPLLHWTWVVMATGCRTRQNDSRATMITTQKSDGSVSSDGSLSGTETASPFTGTCINAALHGTYSCTKDVTHHEARCQVCSTSARMRFHLVFVAS